MNQDTDGDGKCNLNCDDDGDEWPDRNIDLDGDGIPDINIDTDGDGKPDTNLDIDKDGNPDINVDKDKDGKGDWNKMNQDTDGDGKCDLNCDDDGDEWPDRNIDLDGDGKPDLNVDTDNDGKCDLNCDSNKDGKCDYNCDTDGDGKCDTKCDEIEIVLGKNFFIEDIIVLNAKDVGPGWSGEQIFKIKNDSSDTVRYTLNWKNVINTFTETNNLDYTLTRNGQKVGISRAPYIESPLIENELINPHSENTYVIKYEFKETYQDQNLDQGKIFSTNLEIVVK